MSTFEDPNREAVGLEPAWVEGTGGEAGEPVTVESVEAQREAVAASETTSPASLDELTKDELLAHAQEIGASPANAGMTKDELRASIDAKAAEGG